jgi:hypothetical protein
VSECQFGGDNTIDNAKKFLGKNCPFLGYLLNMKKIIKLTESDLVRLVNKVISEQESYDENVFDEIMKTLDYIANHFDRNTTEEELEFLISQIEYEVDSASREEDLSEEEFDEIVVHADFLIDDMVSEFRMSLDENRNSKERMVSEYGYYPGMARDAQAAINWYKQNSHDVNQVLQIGTAFIPVVGPFISAGIGLVDASMYSNEGRKGEAGVAAFFALLPGIGSVVSKVPGVKQLGQKGMQALASKLLTKAPLSAVEQGVVNGINLNKALIKQETSNVIKSMASKAVAKVRDKATQKVMMNLAKDGLEAKAEDVAMTVAATKPTYRGTAQRT